MWILPIVGIGAALLHIIAPWWIERTKKQWKSSLERFATEHHGSLHVADSEDRVLLVVNPAAGCGKAMKAFASCLDAFLLQRSTVEVYVTKGAEDVRSLTKTKDLSKYTCIAFLSGDSTISELMQETLRTHGDKWPYAPILHLAGGSANVIANELFPADASGAEIIAQYHTVKRGSVLKATGSDGKSIFAVQIFGGGMLYGLIAMLEANRHSMYTLFGKLGLLPLLLYNLFRMATMYKDPAMLSVLNSEHEADGLNFQLGLTRLDHNMCIIQVDQFSSGFQGLLIFISMMSGQMGKNWKAGKTEKNVNIQLSTKYIYDHPLELMADGSLEIALKSDIVTFEAIPDAVAFWTP